MSVLQQNPVLGHITTFGGHPVSAAAAEACLQLVESEKLTERARDIEQILREELKHDAILEMRGIGAMMALQFDSYETNKAIIDRCIKGGVITDWFLYNPAALRICPPLNIAEDCLRNACGVIRAALDAVFK